jgi:hypothetical protein
LQGSGKAAGSGGFFMEIEILSAKGKTLIRIVKLFAFIWVAGAMVAAAETADSAAVAAPVAVNPVAQVRQNMSWEYGPFVNWGTGVGDRSDYKFLWAGVQLAKPLSPVVRAGIFSGQFEFGGNIMPLWQAYTPAPHMHLQGRRPLFSADWRRHLSRRQPDPGDSAMEFPDQQPPHSALVPGRGWADLYHPQVPAESHEHSDYQWRDQRLEFFAAGRCRPSLLH